MKRKDGNVMNVVRDRLDALRKLMKERGMDAYMIPTADFHESEYVGEHFKCREYMTGFTGSAGTALITMDEACLWVDGRYYVQAALNHNHTIILPSISFCLPRTYFFLMASSIAAPMPSL